MATTLVFCSECKHFRSGFSDRHYEHCVVAESKIVTTHLERRETPKSPAEMNASNDCKKFERGRLIVTRCALAAPVGALATFEIEAVADGPFEIVPIGVEAPPATLAVRRAIDLVGTVLGGD